MNEKKSHKAITPLSGSTTFLFAISANLIVQILGAIIIVGVQNSNGTDLSTNTIFNFILMLLIQVAFVGVYFLTVTKKNLIVDINYNNRPHKTALLLAPCLAILSILAFYAPTIWFSVGLDKIGYETVGLSDMETPFEYILGLFVLLVAAPIGEELIFRGALLSGLKQKIGGRNAVILSALAFMLMHMSASQTVYQFLLGLVLGFAALYTGSIFIPMIIHSASNLIAFLIDYTALSNLIENFIQALPNVFVAVLVSILFVAAFNTAIYFVLRVLKSRKIQKGSPESEEKGSLELEAKPLADTAVANDYEQSSAQPQTKATFEERAYKPIFLFAAGLCMFMWIIGFVTSI